MGNTHYYQSPLGWWQLTAGEQALTSLRWVGENHGESGSHAAVHPLLIEASKQLDEYFSGKRKTFDVPLAPEGTAFRQKVWHLLQQIPYGKTISYAQLAQAAGNPKACRAVGSANGKNPVAILIPCHRVINTGGKLGGYAYGLEIKRLLLELEKGV
ncbi:MAG: methylated-DNA--[protein]-cysteine S-methyltransferase [Dysgonamonadaceae bacterium]|jgi:methylated-DNA-[protein]-cysteine S-methyltransferase|nr:methylated-DNA--[protein]-cysteine S-methyltransferase [Dysgonamonadaceae bacterium]